MVQSGMYTQTYKFSDVSNLFFSYHKHVSCSLLFRGSCHAKNNSGRLKEQFSMACSPSLPPFGLLGVSPLLYAYRWATDRHGCLTAYSSASLEEKWGMQFSKRAAECLENRLLRPLNLYAVFSVSMSVLCAQIFFFSCLFSRIR